MKIDRTPLEDLERAPTRETIRELIDRGYSRREIVEFCNTTDHTIRRRLDELGLDTNGVPRARSSVARTLWQMDPDEIGGDA